MSQLISLDNIRIASPCSARWNAMPGDDRVRFCESCQKHVYNLTAMTAEAATRLIADREGSLCIRLHRRADGTVLTSDCPIGTRQLWHQTRKLVVSCAAVSLVASGCLLMPNLFTIKNERSPTSSPAISQQFNELWDDVLVWIGWRTRFVPIGEAVMGGCPAPPSGPTGSSG